MEGVLSGYEAAVAIIEKCASDKSFVLDLQQLSLSDTDINRIDFGCVTHIRLSMLPASIGCLHNLRILHAGANPLKFISPVFLSSLSCLEELDVGFGECLEELPNVFDQTPALRVLRAGNNRLNSIPITVYSCPNLEELHVYGNCITQLDSCIGKLKRLRVLNVGRNQLSSLPLQLAKCRNLERLRAYENSLVALPTGLDDISSLVELNLVANSELPVIPDDIRVEANARKIAAFLAKT